MPGLQFIRVTQRAAFFYEADFLDQQVAETLAQTKPNNLGVAYLQGISQEVLSTMIRATRSTTELLLDPTGTVLDSAKGLVEAIRGRMDKEGESFWEAVNSVLNPVTRLVRAGEQANEIAGEALAAARRGELDNAVRLAREAGRSATQSGLAAADLYSMGTGVAGAYSRARGTLQRLPTRRRGIPDIPPEAPRPSRPPQPQSRPRAVTPDGVPGRSEVDPIPVAPPSRPRPDGLTGTVIHDGAGGPQRPAPVVVSRPHPAQPEVPVFDRQWVEPVRQMREQLHKIQQAEAAEQVRALPPEQRLDTKYRNTRPAVKAGYNSKEWLTAADLQLAYPDRGYLTEVELVSVVRRDGVEIPAREIGMAIDPKRPGRKLDVLEVRPEGTYRDYELKTTTSIEEAYPAKGVEVKDFKKSTVLGTEIRKANAVFDYAVANNGKVRVSGKALDGQRVELELDPALFRGTTPSTYREVPN